MKKKFSQRSVRVFSRHPSHDVLRKAIMFPKLACIRLGSTTAYPKAELEINSVESVKNSSSKKLMKQKFTENSVITAEWFKFTSNERFENQINKEIVNKEALPFPIVAKSEFGSRGRGNYLLNNLEEFEEWANNRVLDGYIFEKFYNYNREYRIHVTIEGCFYTCRKMLKSDTPEDKRWFRNDSNSVWILEDNEQFDKPSNWASIVEECVKALKSVKLDIGACDVRVQSSKNSEGKIRKEPKFIVVEINSAPSFGEITAVKYKEQIKKILTNKQ